MISLGVLVSGGGTNLQAILDAIAKGTLDARVSVVISNVAGAVALGRAEKAGVPGVVVTPVHSNPGRGITVSAAIRVESSGMIRSSIASR